MLLEVNNIKSQCKMEARINILNLKAISAFCVICLTLKNKSFSTVIKDKAKVRKFRYIAQQNRRKTLNNICFKLKLLQARKRVRVFCV